MTAASLISSIKTLYVKDFEEDIVLKRFVDPFKDKNDQLIITPNRVTTARGILVIPGIWIILSGMLWLSAIYIGLVFWLDRLDGLIAKKRNLSTLFGKIYDPAMDKVKEVLLLFTFLTVYDLWSLDEPSKYAIVIFMYLLAEGQLFLISLYKLQISKGHPTKFILEENEGANNFGKAKTFVSFAGMLVNIPLLGTSVNPDYIAPIYFLAFILAILSGWNHLSAIQEK